MKVEAIALFLIGIVNIQADFATNDAKGAKKLRSEKEIQKFKEWAVRYLQFAKISNFLLNSFCRKNIKSCTTKTH